MDDPEATVMRLLYAEHAAAIWRYAVRLTGDRARAEDVVQETLLRAWLFTVARNLVIDERRSARFRSESGTPDVEAEADRAGPDESESMLDRMLLGEAIRELSEEHRAVISRAYYRGWSTAQIAEDLHIAEGTVKSRLHYGVRALRLRLEEMGVTR